MALSATQITFLCIIGVILLARPAHAFGAGNIGSTSKIEGENWRHGDLEDVLLTLATSRAMGGKKFSKLDVKRVYFGNWLRDYSQAVDVGTVKYVSAEAIRLLLWILGFMSFGYGTKEFEVTTERLGCYRPEEHIDNPKDYADNEDARQYDRRLRGPIDERRELAIDPETGMKAYIASENLGIDTSAALIRKLFSRSIELGRRYGRNKNKEDLYEALRLLGTGCHCMEDFSAHSNYTELALIELGERDIFPHVGRNTQVRLRGARSSVYPIVTGTFGGVDFLHSVTGEFDDKATQSEIQELEGTLEQAQSQAQNTSALQDLLNKVPDGVFGGKDEAGKANELKTNAAQHQMQNTRISPRQPEEWLRYIEDARAQIYPIIEWHDEVMQGITETIEKIPILPDLLEQLQDEVNIFVFSLIAPFMLPIIKQIKSELNTGSSAIIQSSVEKQHIVFSDDNCSDPTHSMLSKDHFSNVLNEPAGKVAGQVLRWAVPQIIQCWDDERADVDRTINRVIRGVFHHPALRDQGDDGASEGRRAMFGIVEDWWRNKSDREKDGLRDQLNRRGVESGRNHKPGVVDHGHGSAKKLGMPKVFTSQASGAPGGFGVGNSAAAAESIGKLADEAVGGGALGGLVGGLASALGGGVLSGGTDNDNTQSYNRTSYGDDGSRTHTTTRISDSNNRHSETQYSRTEDRYGNQSQEYSRHEQRQSGGGRRQEETSYSSHSSESHRYGSGNDQQTSNYGRQQEYSSGGGYGRQESSFNNRRDDDQPSYGRRNEQSEYSSGGYGNRRQDDNDDDNDNRRGNRSSYGRQQESNTGGYSSQQFSSGRRNDDDDSTGGGYGHRQEETSSYGGGYGRRQEETSSYSRQDRSDYSSGGGYGRQQQSEYSSGGYGGRNDDNDMPGSFGGGRRDDDNDGGYGNRRRNDDDDDNNNRGYGGGRGDNRRSREYESGGYGY